MLSRSRTSVLAPQSSVVVRSITGSVVVVVMVISEVGIVKMSISNHGVTLLRAPPKRKRDRSIANPAVLRLTEATTVAILAWTFEILRTMRVERVTLVCDGSVSIEDVVSVPWAVRLANSTEVDVGRAIGLRGYPHLVAVLMRYTSFLGDRAPVVTALPVLGFDVRQPSPKRFDGLVELVLAALEFGLRAFVFGLCGLECSLGARKLDLGTLERVLVRLQPIAG